MILEGIVTTVSASGVVNIAPMGPHVEAGMDRFLLRPFRTAQTYHNLQAHPEGVFHVTDDVLLLAQAALGVIDPWPPLIPAGGVRGHILKNCCRYYEFQVRSIDDSAERSRIDVAVVHSGRLRDFFGFNRAKHAVVEAAILATRTDFLPLDEMDAEYRKLAIVINKTGGDQEQQAFALLRAHLARAKEKARRQGEQKDAVPEV